MRALALDVGSKSCGIAVSDEMKIIAQGKENYRFELEDWTTLIAHLKNNYLTDVDTVVIGYPTLPSGDKSKTTLMIEHFKGLLEKEIEQKIVFVDENHSTTKAHDVMIQAGMTRKRRKEKKDQLAAVIILQEYLSYL